jgi:hypothetical protein
MESAEKQKAIEQFKKSIISTFDKIKKVNFDGMKSEIANGCMVNPSIVKNVNSDDFVFEEGVTLESMVNDANNEIKKIVDAITITEDDLDEIKKSMIEKIDFQMTKGEMIFYQKVTEMTTAYITINQISNSLKNSLLYVLTSNKKS